MREQKRTYVNSMAPLFSIVRWFGLLSLVKGYAVVEGHENGHVKPAKAGAEGVPCEINE